MNIENQRPPQSPPVSSTAAVQTTPSLPGGDAPVEPPQPPAEKSQLPEALPPSQPPPVPTVMIPSRNPNALYSGGGIRYIRSFSLSQFF